MPAPNKSAKVTEETRAESRRLRAIWDATENRPSQAVFGEMFDIGSQSAVGFFLNGQSPISLKAARGFARGLNCQIADFSQRLAKLAALNADFAAPSAGNSGAAINTVSAIKISSHPDNGQGGASIEIHQFDTGGAMGGGLVLRDQPGLIRSWQVNEEWMQKNVRNVSAIKNLAIVTGFGDSMRPMFNPGDPLLVDTGVKTVDFESVYFFRVGDEGFVKRLQRIPGQGILVISENQSYRDWTVTKDMDFEVFARVIKVWRGEDF